MGELRAMAAHERARRIHTALVALQRGRGALFLARDLRIFHAQGLHCIARGAGAKRAQERVLHTLGSPSARRHAGPENDTAPLL